MPLHLVSSVFATAAFDANINGAKILDKTIKVVTVKKLIVKTWDPFSSSCCLSRARVICVDILQRSETTSTP